MVISAAAASIDEARQPLAAPRVNRRISLMMTYGAGGGTATTYSAGAKWMLGRVDSLSDKHKVDELK